MRSTRLLLEPQALLTSDHCLSYTCFQEDPFLKTPQREFKALQGNFHFQNLMGKAFSHQNSRVKEVNYSKGSKASSCFIQSRRYECANEHFIRHNEVSDIWYQRKISFKFDRIPSLFSRKNCSFTSSKGQFYDGEVKRWKKFDFTEEELQEIERIWKMRLMSKNGCGISNDQVQKGKGGNKDSLSKLRSEFHYGFKGVFLWKKVSCLNRCRKFWRVEGSFGE